MQFSITFFGALILQTVNAAPANPTVEELKTTAMERRTMEFNSLCDWK